MSRQVIGIVSLGIVLALARPAIAQGSSTPGEKKAPPPPTSTGTAGEKKAPTPPTTKGDEPGSSDPAKDLDAADAAEVRKYSDDLKRAGVPAEDVTTLVREEAQERLSKKHPPAVAQGSKPGKDSPAPTPASPTQGKGMDAGRPGMGPYVRGLLAQGLRGKELADAIHAEQKRRPGANDHATGHPGDSEHGKGATGTPHGQKQGDGAHDGKPQGSPSGKPQTGHDSGSGASGGNNPGKHEDGDGSDKGKDKKEKPAPGS